MPDTHDTLLTRRRGLQLLGGGAGGLLLYGTAGFGSAVAKTSDGDDHVADAASACTLTAEQEEGPFYVAVDDVRSDIVLGQSGIALELEITIINTRTCKPIRHAAVDIWHCNALGVYSDISSEETSGETYLRGVQFTDKHGQATFNTIFPGHYQGRTTHIHARVHIGSGNDNHQLTGGHICHTGQIFPTQAAYTEVYATAPYNTETATVVTHAEDRVWTEQHGSTQQLKIKLAGGALSRGLIGTVVMGVDPRASPALIGATS
jgi:protocatechuate 3,4-dioxygenase beta subunit